MVFFRPGDIFMDTATPCTVLIKSPDAPVGTTFQFDVTFNDMYSLGVDPATNQVRN